MAPTYIPPAIPPLPLPAPGYEWVSINGVPTQIPVTVHAAAADGTACPAAKATAAIAAKVGAAPVIPLNLIPTLFPNGVPNIFGGGTQPNGMAIYPGSQTPSNPAGQAVPVHYPGNWIGVAPGPYSWQVTR